MSDRSRWLRLIVGNVAGAATFSGGAGWQSGGLSLEALTDPAIRLYSRPARCLYTGVAADDLAATEVVVDLGRAQAISAIHLDGLVNMPPGAEIRLIGAADAAFTINADLQDSGFVPWCPRIHRTRDLAWTRSNTWSGRPTPAELAAYGARYTYLPARTWSARYIKIQSRLNVATPGHFDWGYLFIGQALTQAHNIALGRTLSPEARDIVTETPSGHEVIGVRRPGLRLTTSWDILSKDEAMTLVDVGMTHGAALPVVVIPEGGDLRHRMRESFLARMKRPPEPSHWANDGDGGLWSALNFELRKVIA